MKTLSHCKSDFAALLKDSKILGKGSNSLGPQTQKFYEKYEIAQDYLDELVPDTNYSVGAFCVLGLSEVEVNLSELSYSEEFRTFGLLPISEFDNDKLCCIDCEYPAFIVLQLGYATVQLLREFLLFRANSFWEFMKYMKWKNGVAE